MALRGWPLSLVLLPLVTAAGCLHAAPGTRGDPGAGPVTVRFSHPADAVFARRVREALPAALPLAQRFGAIRAPVTITIHPSHASLEAAAGRPGYGWLRAWARSGSIELQSVRTWSTGEISDDELHTLLVHELTHCAMYQAIGAQGGRRIPIWFREGMAAFTSGERFAPRRGDPAGPASYREDAPRVYVHAERAFRTLVEWTGDDPVRRVLALLRGGAPFAEAFRAAVGIEVEEFDADIALAEAPPPPPFVPIVRASAQVPQR